MTDVEQVAAAMTGNDARALEVQRMSDAIVAAFEGMEGEKVAEFDVREIAYAIASATCGDDSLVARSERQLGPERMKKPTSLKMVLNMIDTHAVVIRQVYRPLFNRMKAAEARIAELGAIEARLAEVEARPTMKYCGSWDRERDYIPGECVTWDGSTWHAQIKNKGVRPGDGANWVLMVKKGFDARDSRR